MISIDWEIEANEPAILKMDLGYYFFLYYGIASNTRVELAR